MESLPKILLDQYRLPVGIFLVAVVVVGGGVLALLNARSHPPEIRRIEESSSDQSNKATASAVPLVAQRKIKVDIAGAVVNPGVYELLENVRVEEALEAAGGFSNEADRDWVSKNLNLATKLSDGGKIYIPVVGETAKTPMSADTSVPAMPPSSVGAVSGAKDSSASDCSHVNINTASAAVLADCLPGIGATKAQSIVKYREEHSGFKNIEEIKNVSGIAEGTFAKIKDQITVD